MADNQNELEALFSQTPGQAPKRQRRKKRKTLRNWLITVGALLLLIAIAAGIAIAVLNNAFSDIKKVEAFDPTLERPAAVEVPKGQNAPINILLLGSDSRETTDPNAVAEDLKGFRSDAIMVAQISPDRKNVTVMSIMRDNWVEIQGHGEAKINAAVAYGGIPLAVNTVENFIDARIDHVALIDFESFKGLTDAVGGVTVDNPIAFTSHHGNYTFPQGEVTLSGDEALGFVRERYAFDDGDYQRARNQQLYIKGLISKILSKDTLSSPSKVTATFNAVKPYLILDSEFSLQTAASLGLEMRNMRSDDIRFFTSPTLGTGTSSDGQSIVLPDWTEIDSLRSAMREGTLDAYATSRKTGSELPNN